MKRNDVGSLWSDKDREEVVEMIDWGWTDVMILEILPHLSRGSVTAFRAHVTRGTYEQGDGQWHSNKSRVKQS